MKFLSHGTKTRPQALDRLKLIDRAVVDELVARGDSRALLSPGMAKKHKRIKVPRRPCRGERSACGRTQTVPGTDLVYVVTGNERGDLYHELGQLYDPRTAEFLDPADPSKRSPEPGAGEELGGLLVSASGMAYADWEGVDSFEEGVLWKEGRGGAAGSSRRTFFPAPRGTAL